MVDCNSCRGRGEVTGPGGGGMELIDCPKCLGEKLIKRVSYKII
jgi:hypothetical protein